MPAVRDDSYDPLRVAYRLQSTHWLYGTLSEDSHQSYLVEAPYERGMNLGLVYGKRFWIGVL